MKIAPIPFDEMQRLDALYRQNILDSKPEARFDRFTRIAHYFFDIPTVFIAFVDDNRVWFKSKIGCEENEEPRETSICGHTICNIVTQDNSSRLFEVLDLEKDNRFYDNPHVSAENGIRFYMGFVLQSPQHRNIGIFCIIDTRPRNFNEIEKNIFMDIGFLVEEELQRQQFLPTDHGKQNEDSENSFANKFLHLSDTLFSVKKSVEISLKKRGIKYKEWLVLNAIEELEFASPHLISTKLGISPPIVTKRLEALEIKRLIDRWYSKDGDRRFVHLKTTSRGKEIWQVGINEINRFSDSNLNNIYVYKTET